MPLDPNIITYGLRQMPGVDINAMVQQQITGMENINELERQRQADALALQDRAAKQQEAEADAAFEAIAPAIATAFSDPSDAGLDAALTIVPPQYQEMARAQIDQLRAIPDLNLRKNVMRGALAQDDYGRAILAQVEPTANMRLQAETAAQRAALDARRLALEEQQLVTGERMTPYQEAQIALDREKFAAEQAEKDAKARGEIGPTEAQKGEVWNPEKQRYDVVPGTKLYRESAAKHTEDYKAKTAVQDRVAESLAKIDYVLADENKDGFGYNFGGYTEAYVGQYVPGQAQDVKNTIESLKADITQAGLELMRSGGSIGAITEREWPLLEKQIAAVTPYVGEKRARELLQNVAQRLRNIQTRATQAYDQQWGDTQFYEPSEALPVETGDSNEELPEGTTSSNW